MTAPLLDVRDLTVTFDAGRGSRRRRRAVVHAVAGVSLEVHVGEIVALVGESGSGKSTVAHTIAGLQRPTGGTIALDGADLSDAASAEHRRRRRAIQLIHQDPFDALDPRLRVGALVEEGLRIHGVRSRERPAAVLAALERVGLAPAEHFRHRYAHELSGGQRQRVAIAAAIALGPRLLVADEPVSMLDMSVRASILRILAELRDEGLGLLFITHDLASAATLADRVAVMYRGRICETGPAGVVLRAPAHPYTRALLAAMPSLRPRERLPAADGAGGRSMTTLPTAGCAFAPRCADVLTRCREHVPELATVAPDHRVACLLAGR